MFLQAQWSALVLSDESSWSSILGDCVRRVQIGRFPSRAPGIYTQTRADIEFDFVDAEITVEPSFDLAEKGQKEDDSIDKPGR
jgi:hypothetical protein